MIQALWIITETGQCIFSHKYVRLDIDDQLISGLLTAFDAFSHYGMSSTIRSMTGRIGRAEEGYGGSS